jgi:Kef-type K+ transport system membrane component KefB
MAKEILFAGIGFVITALANWLGFSVTVGALFAGLVFIRDPDAVKIDTSFDLLCIFSNGTRIGLSHV